MRLKTTIILLGIVAVLALFVQFYEKNKLTTDEWQLQAKQVFPGYESNRVRKIEINREDGLFVMEKLEQGDWAMRKPLELKADLAEVTSILTEMEFLKKIGTVEVGGEGTDLAGYGLEKPKIVFSYWTGPDDKHTFSVGEKRAGGNEVYIKLEGSKDVLLVSGTLLERLAKTLSELRSKNVLEIDPNAVDRIELKYASGEVVECARSGVDWRVTQPIADSGDNEKIMQVVYNLNALVVDKNDFITDEPKDLSTFGLDNPQITAVAYQKGVSQGVLLGHTRDNKVYAKRREGPAVFFLKDTTAGLFKKNPNELRAKKLAREVDSLYVTKCAIKTKDQEIEIEKTVQYDYMIKKPVEVLADRDAFKSFLDAIKDMEIQNFVDDKPADLSAYGLKEPAAEITIAVKDKEPVRLQVGSKDKRGALCYVKRAGEEPVFSVKADNFYEPATRGYLTFRDRLMLEFNRDNARKLVIDRKDRRFVAGREKGATEKWMLSEPMVIDTDEEMINNIVWSLSFLKAENCEVESPKDLAQYGLDNPRIKATITYEEEVYVEEKEEAPEGKGEDIFLSEKSDKKAEMISKTVLVGNRVKEGQNVDSYAIIDGGNLVFHMSWTDIRYLEGDLTSKVVAQFDSDTVSRVHLNFPEKETLYEKKAEVWEMLKPEKKEVLSKEIDAVLYSLKNLKAESIAEYKSTDLAKYGLDKPQATITLNDNKGEKVLVMSQPAAEQPYFAKISNSDFIFVLSNADVQKLIKGQAIVDLKPPMPSMGGSYGDPGDYGGGHGTGGYGGHGGSYGGGHGGDYGGGHGMGGYEGGHGDSYGGGHGGDYGGGHGMGGYEGGHGDSYGGGHGGGSGGGHGTDYGGGHGSGSGGGHGSNESAPKGGH
ncbi:MAG: hypothetical protein A3C38_00555 [Planctomycetes bacterium RIFCSPHIGHO2_02_FULL_50_42]|nr:MAG: hypothetical protein A2060_04515 [Planctomycetes bacterium GWA2_50_13]OHB89765.1 MAG: hypothetical protein A3C38_00555 [Planctomycetes bacterium RIFCSPHIGHO2_02_FULL_50_42]